MSSFMLFFGFKSLAAADFEDRLFNLTLSTNQNFQSNECLTQFCLTLVHSLPRLKQYTKYINNILLRLSQACTTNFSKVKAKM